MEEQSKGIYRCLTEYCSKRAKKSGNPPPIFEPIEVFERCCVDLQIEHLISIKSDEHFALACSMKVLDHLGSSRKEKMAVTALKLRVLSREEYINRILKSSSFTDKKTRFSLQSASE